MATPPAYDPACPAALVAFDPALAERVRCLSPSLDLSSGKDFVLYWMRTAVRLDDNPALDAANVLANASGRPLLIYCAVDERYPFASDRHHTFMLQGARDVARACVSKGLRFAFHLARPKDRGRHLLTLARQATAVVTEDFPLAPLSHLTRKLAETIATDGVPTFAVDTACTVPMRLSPARCDRAFAFKEQVQDLLHDRLGQTRATPPAAAAFAGPLPFEPLNIADADDATMANWVGECAIDHAVGPVAETRGGTEVGSARFAAFLGDRLAAYHQRRNDPLDREGVSEMSAYFHYGHVSPMKAAKLANAQGGDGARKYVDELVHWRELAYHFCFHLDRAGKSPESFAAALPAWAQQTLQAHADDEKTLRSDEVLHRARTTDRFWDACQRSLLWNGRLHNNVRMTWGKALLGWSATPQEALARTIALNHRFALDGRDPASLGGILWCFGQFDRPHSPEAPVFGSVRPRPTLAHGKRIGMAALERQVAAGVTKKAVAVVGAGLAGLAAAHALRASGHDVVLVDKGHRSGGRCSTRSDGDGTLAGDVDLLAHGLPSTTWLDRPATLRNRPLQTLARQWRAQGLLDADAEAVPPRRLTAHLNQSLEIHYATKVTRLDVVKGKWRLSCAPLSDDHVVEAELTSRRYFDAVVLTPPAPQSLALLADVAPALQTPLRSIRYRPLLSALVFDANALDQLESLVLPLDGLAGPEGAARPALHSVSLTAAFGYRQQARTHRSAVFHFDDASSRQLLDEDLQTLAEVFKRGLSAKGIDATSVRVHRWRYAEVEAGLAADYLAHDGLVVAGDAFWGDLPQADAAKTGAENAWLSGTAAAGYLLRRFASESPLNLGDRTAEPS